MTYRFTVLCGSLGLFHDRDEEGEVVARGTKRKTWHEDLTEDVPTLGDVFLYETLSIDNGLLCQQGRILL